MKLLILIPLLTVAAAAQAQIYRCEREGKIAFSDHPCEPGAKATKKFYATSAAVGHLDLHISVRYYNVEGLDYESLRTSLNVNGPMGYHGFASWRCSYHYTTKMRGNACQIATVTTRVSGEILMPRWVDEASAPVALQRRWSDYYSALKTHEDGHIQNGRELALLVKERLMGIGAAPCDQIKALARNEFEHIYENLKARDKEYDIRTNHGATQGAAF